MNSDEPLEAHDSSLTVSRGLSDDAMAGELQTGSIDDQVEPEARTVIRGGSSRHQSPPALPSTDRTPAGVAKVLLGSQLNHFRLDELIGGGGMGAVFRGHDQQLDRTVAVKVIPFVGEDPDLNRRFRNEAQSAAKLDHPNVARVFDVGSFEDWHYIVFEYVEGTNIRDRVLNDGPLSIDDAVFATCQLADAIGHAAGRGIVHRDIKPSNVVINLDEQIKLVDMGLARSESVELSEDMTASGVTLGTFDYISPEQALDPRKADICSDIYSLGCTFYFMLTGQPPYPGGTMLQKLMSHGNAPPPDPRLQRIEISDDLTAVVQRLLAKSPKDRYQTVKDLILDLQELAVREGLVRTLGLSTSSATSDRTNVRGWERHVPWGVAVTLLFGGAIAMQVASRWSDDENIPVSVGGSPIPDQLAMRPTEASIENADGNSFTDTRSKLGDAPAFIGPGDPSDSVSASEVDVETPAIGATLREPNPGGTVVFVPEEPLVGVSGPSASPMDIGANTGPSASEEPRLPFASSPAPMMEDSSLASGFVPRNDGGGAQPSLPSTTQRPSPQNAQPELVPFDVAPPSTVRVVDVHSMPAGVASLEELSAWQDFSQDGVAYVSSFADAISICETQPCEKIELASQEIVSGPIRITREDLQVVSIVGRTSIRLQSPELLSMERARLITVLADRVAFNDIDFQWDVPVAEPNGGAVFSLTENRMFRMTDCTVTVRNPAERYEVRAFEIVTDPEIVARDFSNPSSTQSDYLLDGRELYEEYQLPLVAIELENVIVRGEMTMVHLDYAVELQLKWTNGLLAISERMIDTAGAMEDVGITAPSMQVELNQLTASIPKGLFRMRIGSSGRYPVALDRQAERCVFLVDPGTPQMLITGLRESKPIRSLVQIRGTSNAYPYPSTDLQEPLLMIDDRNGGQEIILSEVLVSDEPEWSREESPRWSVRWSTDPLSDATPSELSPADFRQDGSISVGFDEQALPRVLVPSERFGMTDEVN